MAELRYDDPVDQALTALVRPTDWVNPTPLPVYDLVVIGAGAGGLVSAVGAAGVGAKVAIIEKSLLGGDCLLSGCVPSKALLRSARAVDAVRRASDFGINVTPPSVDFTTIMQQLRQLRAKLGPNDSAYRLTDLGVHVFFGSGRFTGNDSVLVNNATLRYRKAIIATGSRPRIPAIPGLDTCRYLTNETLFNLNELPRRLVIIGAGPIGCEMAQAFARFGSEVTVFARGVKILPRENREAADLLQASMHSDGITFIDAAIDRITPAAVVHSLGETPYDQLLIATGRLPNVENLGLETVNIAVNANGITVDDHLRTTNNRVFAVGDVCTATRFTHAADAMARIAIRNALFHGRGKFSKVLIPHCTYTSPELASVGLTPEQATAQHIPHRLFRLDFRELDRAVLDRQTNGMLKLILAAKKDTILGAVAVGPTAGELIAEITTAMTQNIGLSRLGQTIRPYPSYSEAIRRLSDAYNRTRLTPFTRWLLKCLLKW